LSGWARHCLMGSGRFIPGVVEDGREKVPLFLVGQAQAEPEADYIRKGGHAEDTSGRKCLCNGLFAAIGHGQQLANGTTEPAVVTAGEDVAEVSRFLPAGQTSYTVADVLKFMGIEIATIKS